MAQAWLKYPWWQGLRPSSLLLGASPVLAATGASLAVRLSAHHSNAALGSEALPWWVFWLIAACCLVVACGFQAAVNLWNDAFDALNGVDADRASSDGRKPQRLVAAGVSPKQVIAAGAIAAAIACFAGVIITCLTQRWWLLAFGAACIPAAWYYTGGKAPYGYRGWGEASAAVFFGPVAVLGTQAALLGGVTPVGAALSLAIGAASACLMMINNMRDLATDTQHGKRSLIAVLGLERSMKLFTFISLLSWLGSAVSLLGILCLGVQVWSVAVLALIAVLTMALLGAGLAVNMRAVRAVHEGAFNRAFPLYPLMALGVGLAALVLAWCCV